MTRARACVLSLFGPLVLVVPAILLISIPRLSKSVLGFVIILMFGLALAIRVHFARWYASDKGRSEGWAAVAIAGIWGWLVLWGLEDRGFRFVR